MKKKNIVAFILARKGSKDQKQNLQILFNKTSLINSRLNLLKIKICK